MEKLTLSVQEAGHALGIGRSATYQAIKSGAIPSVRIGGRVLVPRKALEQLLENQMRADTARALGGEGADNG